MYCSTAEIRNAYFAGEDILAVMGKRQRKVEVATAALLLLAAPVVFLGMYWLKSALGINLFEWHLSDLF